jgi:hypothetical protein
VSLTTDAPPSSRQETPSLRRLWIAALAAGVVAGAVGWLGGEAIHGIFLPPVRTVSGAEAAEDLKAANIGRKKEANVAFALLGGAVGLALGLAGGASRRSAGGAAFAAVAGLLLGAAAAFGAAVPLIAIANQSGDRMNDDMVFSILLLGGIASAIGLSGGLAFGVGLGDMRRIVPAAFGGLIGAALGTAFYQVFGTLVFPLDQSAAPLPTTGTSRLVARMAVALFIAAFTVVLVRGPRSRTKKTQTPLST